MDILNYEQEAIKAFNLENEYIELYQSDNFSDNRQSEQAFKDCHKKAMQSRGQFIDKFLASLLHDQEIPSRLSEAMRYSLLAGGKRLRPILCISCAKLCSKDKNWASAIIFASALEMIHTYSLIHDDLPAMDNDDLRRGKPTCHKAYDEASAILAGDGLLTDAFYMMTLSNFSALHVLESIKLISLAVGSQGMVGGQMLDLLAENTIIDLEQLKVLNAKKTGALLMASCETGAVLLGADEKIRKTIVSYGKAIGIAFQIIDDVLDVVGDTKLLGKNVGSDEAKNKSTWVSLIGLEESKKMALEYCDLAYKALEEIKNFPNIDQGEIIFLQKTALDMAHRLY